MTDLRQVEDGPPLASSHAAAGQLDDVLGRLDALEPQLNAFVHVDGERAHRDVHRLNAAADASLRGLLVSVKDNIAVTGAPWAAGSGTRIGCPAIRDAEVVRRIRAAGGIVVGTTNLDEFAMGASTVSSYFGASHNPWDLSRTPGGSSGGAAASVAAYGVLAVGSDTGGSIREPAAQCGVVGVKPSSPAAPTDCVVEFASSLDRVGPLALDVEHAARLDDVLRGGTGLLAAARQGAQSETLRGIAVGVIARMSDRTNSDEVRERFAAALRLVERLGAELIEVAVPSIEESLSVYVDVSGVESIAVLEAHEHRGQGLGEEAAARLEHARSIRGTARLRRALAERDRIARDLREATRRFVLLSPTMPIVAPPIGRRGLDEVLAAPRTDWWTVEANLGGLGAASLPCGLGRDSGLPVGLQLMTAPGADRRLYAVSAILEAAGLGSV